MKSKKSTSYPYFILLDTQYLWCNMHLENWGGKFKDSREMREMVCINVVLSVSSISTVQYFYFWRWSDAEGDPWLGSWGLTSISTAVHAGYLNTLFSILINRFIISSITLFLIFTYYDKITILNLFYIYFMYTFYTYVIFQYHHHAYEV